MHTQTLNKRAWMLVAGVLLVGLAVLIAYSQISFGSITKDDPVESNRFQNYTFFATSTNQVVTGQVLRYATTTAASSTNITAWIDDSNRLDRGYFVVKGAKRITAYFGHGAATNTSNSQGIYTIETSPNGTDWYAFGKLIK